MELDKRREVLLNLSRSTLQEINDELMRSAKIQIMILCRCFCTQSLMEELAVKSECISIGQKCSVEGYPKSLPKQVRLQAFDFF